MDDFKLGLMSSIITFLRSEFQKGYLDSENAEGLEVAIHCLENIFDVRNVVQTVPSLMDMYRGHVLENTLIVTDPSPEEREEGERFKFQGNRFMSNGKYLEALNSYTRAIQCNPRCAVYYCNRAAALSKMDDHVAAVEDCKVAIMLDPNYSKAYGRLGLAYCGLEFYVRALENYHKAHELEPENEGYSRNFELAQSKVMSLCSCNEHNHPDPTNNPAAQNASFHPPNLNPMPTLHQLFNIQPNTQSHNNAPANEDAIPMGQIMDINAIFGNPQLVNIASQMLADPAMQNMGQRLARQMQNENPSFFNLLRQSFTEPGAQGDGNNRQEPGQDGGEPSQDKQQ